jgi:hypothetical protein
MKGHLLALEIKDADVIRDKDGTHDPEKGAITPLPWTVSALVLKPSVKGPVVVNALTLGMSFFVDNAAGDQVPGESSLDDLLGRLAQRIDLVACSRAVVAIPASTPFFRHMDLPFRSRWKIGQVLPMELDAVLPLSDEPHLSDFIFTGLSQSDNYTFLTASLSTKIVDALCTPLEKRGLTPVLISSAGYLAAHLLLGSLPEKGFYLMVEVKSHCLVINGVLDGVIVGLRSIVRGINKNDAGMVMEVGRTLMLFRHRLGITHSLLGCHIIWSDTRDKDLEAQLEKTLDTPVVCEDLSTVSQALENGEIVFESNANEYLNAFAAARCSGKQGCLNFCRNSNGQGAFVEKYMAQLVTMGLLIFICFFMVVAGEYMEIRTLKSQSAAMDRQTASILKETFPDITTIVDPYMQMKIQVRQASEQSGRSLNMESRLTAGSRVTDLFFELSSRIPETIDIELSRLVFNDNRIVLSGNTDNYNSVDKMKTAIESSPLFTDVKISNAAADKNDKRIRFKFIFQTTDGKENLPKDRKENS